jgi:hypothetical protein
MYPKKSLQTLIREFFNVFLNVKNEQKHTKIEMMLELTSFSMSKLKVSYIQPFLTPLFNIGHEKQPFGYVMNFEILLTFIAHNKAL